MKNVTTKIAIMLVGLSLLLSACNNDDTIVPVANVTSQERFVTEYTGIEVSTAFSVDIEYSATEESIIIEANDNLHQYIEVEKVNNKLRIKIRDNTTIKGNATFKAHVITKNQLSSYAAAQASQITLIGPFEATEVTLSLAEASFLNGTITAQSISTFLDGASNATLKGSADTFTANVAQASILGTYEMITQSAILRLSGASNASLTVNGTIDLTASGASSLMYKGTATISNLNLSGASQIIKAD